jgi:hypothetical protein
MVWSPKLNVVDLTLTVDNLLAFIEANQTEALSWANGGPGLADFAAIYPNTIGWLKSKFPSLLVLGQADEGDGGNEGSLVETRLGLRFETAVMGTPDELPILTKKYDLALRSMLVNVPSATLIAGSATITRAYVSAWPASVYDRLREAGRGNSFLQVFQTSMEYTLITAAES